MPVTPATPRRGSDKRRSAPATPKSSDVTPFGVHNTSHIRDRIKQWQEQDVSAKDTDGLGSRELKATTPTSEDELVTKPTTSRTRDKENVRPADTQTAPRRKSGRHAELDRKNEGRTHSMKRSSTPRKRLVSDEHWKAQRSPTKLESGNESGRSTPRRELRTEWSRHNTPEPVAEAKDQAGTRERRRSSRKKPLRASFGAGDDLAALDHAEAKSARRQSGRMLDQEEVEFDNPPQALAEWVKDLPNDLPESPSPRASRRSTRPRRKADAESSIAPEDSATQYERSVYAATLDKSPNHDQQSQVTSTRSVKSRKERLLDHAKDIFTRSEPIPEPSPRVPSIEAWLNEQPDPFIESAQDLGPMTPSVEIPEPLALRPKSKKKREVEKMEVVREDPNKIWNTVEDKFEAPGEQELPSVSASQRRKDLRERRKSRLASRTERTPQTPKHQESTPESNSRPGSCGTPTVQTSYETPDSSFPKPTQPVSSGRRHFSWEPEPLPQVTDPNSEPTVETFESSPSTRRRPLPTLPKACPPTGTHRLETIASVETFHSNLPEPPPIPEDDPLPGSGLHRRLTTHDDLMSVLSLPQTKRGKSVKSVRSVKRMQSRARLDGSTTTELFSDLAIEESKYMRELITLVDGVIPVLLQCVLSKSESSTAKGLFGNSSIQDSGDLSTDLTRPIIDMGVALERLKGMHRRVPKDNVDAILTWAQNSHKVYSEYLKAWRLGFQDVIVNLTPANPAAREADEGMARDEDGDVVDADGKKVDVAYLLKRPLVRIKNLAKIIDRLHSIAPSTRAQQVAVLYDELVKAARRRNNEEQGRLEDEAASNIDATRARDVRSMAVLTGLRVDKTRRVKARDCFALSLHHSTGQRLDCRVELFLRDNQPSLSSGGDLLIAEVDVTGKWLFFPPIDRSFVSARPTDSQGSIVIMIRGRAGHGQEWHELLSLKADDVSAASEWVDMLGQNPLPPRLIRTASFINRQQETVLPAQSELSASSFGVTAISRVPSPSEVEVPIGEPSVFNGEDIRPMTAPDLSGFARPLPNPSQVSTRSGRKVSKPLPLPPQEEEPYASQDDVQKKSPSEQWKAASGLGRNRATSRRHTAGQPESPSVSQDTSTRADNGILQTKLSRTDEQSKEWMSSPLANRSVSPETGVTHGDHAGSQHDSGKPQRPVYSRALSSTPSHELPTIPRIRPASPAPLHHVPYEEQEPELIHQLENPLTPKTKSPKSTPLSESIRDGWFAFSGLGKRSGQRTDAKNKRMSQEIFAERKQSTAPAPVPAPTQEGNLIRSPSPELVQEPDNEPVKTSPPPHQISASELRYNKNKKSLQPKDRTPQPPKSKSPNAQSATRGGKLRDRRSSSPLKREYAPSTSSESSDDSETDESLTSDSDTSEDLDYNQSEVNDVAMPLQSHWSQQGRKVSESAAPQSIADVTARTIAPSSSASQAPFRHVPDTVHDPIERIGTSTATVCAWSDKGSWEMLYPDECSIVISPGLIEAFEMTAEHSRPGSSDDPDGPEYLDRRPIVGFELTPLVPLRRGTALDISIRSMTTANSQIRSSTNVMFRSRSSEECEALYTMINLARINNPTYIALEKARPAYEPTFNTNMTNKVSARHSAIGSSKSRNSWFGFGRKNSYRAPVGSSPSIGAMSESSVGSVSSALSALKRLSGSGGGAFNLNRSSVIRKNGRNGSKSGAASLYSSSSGTTGTNTTGAGSGATTPILNLNINSTANDVAPKGTQQTSQGVVNNMKIRLYIRENAARWRDLGAGRLSVLPAEILNNGSGAATPTAGPDSGAATPTNASTSRFYDIGSSSSRPASMSFDSTPPVVGRPGQARGPRLPSADHTPHRTAEHLTGYEKRIVITSKNNKPLLDATLHESSFEKIARTGIAVNVWTEDALVAATGGVAVGKTRTYMVQCRGEAEATWVFGLVGRLRY